MRSVRAPKAKLLASALLLATVASACSSSGSATDSQATSGADGAPSSGNSADPSAPTGSSAPSGTTGDISQIQAEIAKYSAVPQAVPPGPAFDASKAQGKTVWTVPTSSTVPVIKLENDALTAALSKAGVKTVNFSTDGSPNSWVNAMNQALGHNASLIVLEGVDPKLISAQVKQAKAAGVPVIWDWAIQGPVSEVAPDVTATNPLDFNLGAKLLADLATVYSKGKANIQIFGLQTQRQDSVYVDGIKAELGNVCKGCGVSGYTNVPIPNWSQHLTQETRNLIASHPDVNVLVPVYDGMVEFIAPGVTQANAADRVMVVTHDGTPAVISQIKSGDVVKADIGESREWQAWALADQSLRILSGVDPVATENIPVRIWTKENAGEATGPNPENGYGDSYIAMYEKLWGIAK